MSDSNISPTIGAPSGPGPTSSFPPELMALIFRHALPDPTTANFAARSSLLRSISLLSQAWREHGQAELFAHPVIRADAVGRGGVQTGTALLVDTLRLNPRLKGMVRTLYVGRTGEGVGDRGRWRAVRVRELLDECDGITQLGLESLFGLDLTWLNWMTKLTSLSLHNIEGTISASLSLPHLTSLSLSHCELWEEDWSTLISPSALPSLRALGIFGQPALSKLLAPLPPAFVAQLEALFTNPLAERAWTGRTAHGDRIACPVLWESLSARALENLFATERDEPVRHLRCRGWRDAGDLKMLADLLSGVGPESTIGDGQGARMVAGLRTLWVDELDLGDEEAAREMRRVEAACKAAEIELVREGDGDQKASLVSVKFWARAKAGVEAAAAAGAEESSATASQAPPS